MNRIRRLKRMCFTILALFVFAWIFIFSYFGRTQDLESWSDDVYVSPTLFQTVGEVNPKSRYRNTFVLFKPDKYNTEEDDNIELSPSDVMEYMGEKIHNRYLAHKFRSLIIKEVMEESNKSVAVIQAAKEHNITFKYNMTFWTMGFSIAEVFDIQNVLKPLGVKLKDRSFSSLCSLTESCAQTVFSTLSKDAIFKISHNSRREFARKYATKKGELDDVQAILCLYPVHLCELLYRLGKPVIFLTANRYELGKSEIWMNWNYVIKVIKQDLKNIVAARDEYDARYLDYFTKTQPLTIPRHCGYINSYYSPIKNNVLLYPGLQEDFLKDFQDLLYSILKYYSDSQVKIDEKKQVDPMRLKEYRAVIYIPNRVSSITFTEIYRMNIPLYVPSLKLLVEWEVKYRLLQDRIFPNSTAFPSGGSKIGAKHPVPQGSSDPNSYRKDNLVYWFKYLEYFGLPGVQYFSSVDELIKKINTKSSLQTDSNSMKKYNQLTLTKIRKTWEMIVRKMRDYKLQKPTLRPTKNRRTVKVT